MPTESIPTLVFANYFVPDPKTTLGFDTSSLSTIVFTFADISGFLGDPVGYINAHQTTPVTLPAGAVLSYFQVEMQPDFVNANLDPLNGFVQSTAVPVYIVPNGGVHLSAAQQWIFPGQGSFGFAVTTAQLDADSLALGAMIKNIYDLAIGPASLPIPGPNAVIGNSLVVQDTAANTTVVADLTAIAALNDFASAAIDVRDTASAIGTQLDAIVAGWLTGIAGSSTSAQATVTRLTPNGKTQTVTLSIGPTDGEPIPLTVAQYRAIDTMPAAVRALIQGTLAITDSASQIESLTITDIDTLPFNNVSQIESDGSVALGIDHAVALAFDAAATKIVVPAGSALSVVDSAAAISSINTDQIDLLKGLGVTAIVSNDGAIALTVSQALALLADQIGVSAQGAAIVLTDNLPALQALSAAQYSSLGAIGITKIESTDDPVVAPFVLDVLQAAAIASQQIPAVDVSDNSVAVADLAVNIGVNSGTEALSPGQIGILAGDGIRQIESTDATDLLLDAVQTAALITQQMTVAAQTGLAEVFDQDTAIEGFSAAQLAILRKSGLTQITATDGPLSFTVDQALAIAGTAAALVVPTDTNNDAVTVRDSAAAVGALTTNQLDALLGDHFGLLASNTTALQFTAEQVRHLEQGFNTQGPLGPGDNSAAVVDTATNIGAIAGIEGLTAGQIAGLPLVAISTIQAQGALLPLSVEQAKSVATAAATVIDPLGVEVADSAATIGAVDAATFTGIGTALGKTAGSVIDVVATDKSLQLDVTAAIAAVQAQLDFTTADPADTVVLTGAGATIGNLSDTEIAAVGKAVRQNAGGFTLLSTPDSTLQLNNSQALTAVTARVRLDAATKNGVQVLALPADISSYDQTLYDALAASGFNEIVATAPVDVDVTKAVTAVGDGFVFAGNSAADQVTLSGDAATIEALSTTDIAAVGRAIRENPGSETLLKANDGPVKIPTDQADVFVARAVRLNAPGAHNVQLLSAKAQITGFAAADIDTFSNAGFNAFESTDGAFGVGAGAAIAASTDGILFGAGPGGVVSVSDLAANVEAMTPAQLDQLNNEGITAIVATDGPLIFDAAQAAALLDPVTVSVPAGDDITLTDTAAHVEGLSPDQIAGLPGIGFHGIAVTDTSLAFDVGQALAFLSSGLVVGVPLGDGLFVSDTQANLDGLNPSQAAGLQNAGFLTEVACFAAGTSVATADGPVAVEDLAIGDRVVTIDGTPEPVVWIGSREVDCRRHPHPETVWPVRVRAGAFGENVPVRDLYLSPDHAIFVNGVLVPVKLLIDGSSIVQVRRSAIAYYHVELPRHAVILAEGLTVESFLDTGDKANFLRDGETVRLFPDFAARFGPQTARVWETLGAARLITSGPELTAARQRVKNPCPATMANRRLRT